MRRTWPRNYFLSSHAQKLFWRGKEGRVEMTKTLATSSSKKAKAEPIEEHEEGVERTSDDEQTSSHHCK